MCNFITSNRDVELCLPLYFSLTMTLVLQKTFLQTFFFLFSNIQGHFQDIRVMISGSML